MTARGSVLPLYQDPIADAQARLRPMPALPRTRQEYRRVARWWELEAKRWREDYAYGPDDLPAANAVRYAANMRWAAEMAGLYGPGTWTELKARRAAAGGAP